MCINIFHLKVGAIIGGAVGLTSGNILMITQSFNNASADWKAGAMMFGGAFLGGLGGAAYMSDRTNIAPLVPLKSLRELALPENRKEVLKPLAVAILGTAMCMQGYLFNHNAIAGSMITDTPRYELKP